MNKKHLQITFSSRLMSILASQWFWRVMLGIFIVQAVYIALVGRFSMAFDEHFHLKAIQEYSKVILPWQVTQPPGPAELSAFTADGSYLYHYLMSFPYRLIQLVSSSQTVQIVLLRLMDVGLVVVGWQIFRRLLREIGASKAATHGILAFVMLMPMAPFMAGQLTYDALFFMLVALTMLLFVRLLRVLHEQKTLPLPLTAWTAAAVLATLQVKYAFFPAALGAGLYLVGYLVWLIYTKKIKGRRLLPQWKNSLQTGTGAMSVGVMLLLSVLFVQRYGMNFIQYGSFVPECPAVLSHERCLGFAPYGRDTEIRDKGWFRSITTQQKLAYPSKWYEKMIYESYFSVGPKEIGYVEAKPLPVPYTAGKVLVAASLLVICLRLRPILRRNKYSQLLFVTVSTYVLFLFLKNYGAFLATAIPLSIHGRYVLPFLPLLGYLVYLGVRPLYQKPKLQIFIAFMVSGLFIASLWGGGIGAFVVWATDSWYWEAAQPISRTVRSILEILVLR